MSAIFESLPAKLKKSMPLMTTNQVVIVKNETEKVCQIAINVVNKFDDFLEEYYS